GLLLSLTDQLDQHLPGTIQRAREVLPRLKDEYERAYYAGIICERRAKVLLHQAQPGASAMAFDMLSQARGHYEQAEKLRPPGNDDVLLRWNACARLMMRHPKVGKVTDEFSAPYADA